MAKPKRCPGPAWAYPMDTEGDRGLKGIECHYHGHLGVSWGLFVAKQIIAAHLMGISENEIEDEAE